MQVTPTSFCSFTGGSLQITGSEFVPLSQVYLQLNCTPPCNLSPIYGNTTYINSTLLDVTFPPNIPAGLYYILVIMCLSSLIFYKVYNGMFCQNPPQFTVEVRPILLAFFVDPPTIYNGINIQVFEFSTDFDML